MVKPLALTSPLSNCLKGKLFPTWKMSAQRKRAENYRQACVPLPGKRRERSPESSPVSGTERTVKTRG